MRATCLSHILAATSSHHGRRVAARTGGGDASSLLGSMARRLLGSMARCGQAADRLCATAPCRALQRRRLAAPSGPLPGSGALTKSLYERISDEAMQRMCDYFEAVGDSLEGAAGGDAFECDLSSGVLTLAVRVGSEGQAPGGTLTFVVNKQPPNMQIWLSSPLS